MKFIKVIVQFEAKDIFLAEEIICHVFFSNGLNGVVCDVPLEEPDEGFGTKTLPPPETCSVTGFFPDTDTSLITIGRIKTDLEQLNRQQIHTRIQTDTVDEADWADAWKAYFDVTPITERITVKPEWKGHTPRKDEIILHLDPGMAFGTGTHPTTAMCIALIEEYLRPGSSFLDVGTGSGILMIAAQKLGAKRLVGIDTDETAVEIARKNLEKNNIEPQHYALACTTLAGSKKASYDLVAANIIAQVIVQIMPHLAARMHENSIAILSGIIPERKPDVAAAMEEQRLVVIQEKTMDEWVALAVKKISN